eukprot:473521-Pyramimonas_sp.AAC.1
MKARVLTRRVDCRGTLVDTAVLLACASALALLPRDAARGHDQCPRPWGLRNVGRTRESLFDAAYSKGQSTRSLPQETQL